MSTQSSTLAIFILAIVALLAFAVYLSRFLFKRTLRALVREFRKRGATSPQKAVTLEELGLVRTGPFDRMFRMRDYRPQALRVLGQANVVRSTEEGTLYLSEEELSRSRLKDFARID